MPKPTDAPAAEEHDAGRPRRNACDRLADHSGCPGVGESVLLAALAACGHATFPEPDALPG